jgi:hypothetical protein
MEQPIVLPTRDFPMIFAAVAARYAALMEHHADNLAAVNAPDQACRDRLQRLVCRQSWAVCVERQAIAYAAYATELLPAITPHMSPPWSPGKAGHLIGDHEASTYGRKDIPDLWSCPRLLDHPAIFRRQGVRGPTTWRNAVQIGEPYWIDAPAEAVNEARYLAGFGLGVWHRTDLSAWFPGRTNLVVIARGLRPEDAPTFGFTAVDGLVGSPPPPPADCGK